MQTAVRESDGLGGIRLDNLGTLRRGHTLRRARGSPTSVPGTATNVLHDRVMTLSSAFGNQCLTAEVSNPAAWCSTAVRPLEADPTTRSAIVSLRHRVLPARTARGHLHPCQPDRGAVADHPGQRTRSRPTCSRRAHHCSCRSATFLGRTTRPMAAVVPATLAPDTMNFMSSFAGKLRREARLSDGNAP